MMTVNTKEKARCFEIIEEMTKKILELEQQGYSCEYYKVIIGKVKGIEGNLKLERDFDRTVCGYAFKPGLAEQLEKRYESMVKIFEEAKNNLHIDKEKDENLNLLLEEGNENLNYDIDTKKLEDYIQRIIPYFSSVIKKDCIMPLAELTYKIIKVEYSQKFTTNMLYIIRPYNGIIIKALPIYEHVCKYLDIDLHKYGINKTNKYFDGYLIEKIVEKDNKNFIPLDERLEQLRRKKINNKNNQEALDNEDVSSKELNCQNNQTISINENKILNIYINLLKKIMKLIGLKKESLDDNAITSSSKDLELKEEEVPKIYKAALKRVSISGEITAFNTNSSRRIEHSSFMVNYEIYVKYNKSHPEAAYEILTGKKIPVVDSETKVEEELPPAFIERKIKEDTIDFYKITKEYDEEFRTYLESNKDRLDKQLEIWEYEGKKAIYQNLIKEEGVSHQKVLK
mgnify:CR=1 FL=1